MFDELDTVRLLVDMPTLGLRRGAVGAILMIHTSPSLAYEVEFEGTEETVALGPDRLERVLTTGS